MRVKRFVGNNVHEAMQQVKQEMGSNAVILHTRSIKPKGLLGFLKKEQVEITAAIDNSTVPVNQEKLVHHPDIKEVTNQIYQVQQLMNEVKNELEISQPISGYPKNLQKLYQGLVESHVDVRLAKRIIKKTAENCSLIEMKNFEICESKLLTILENMLRNVVPIELKDNKLKVIGLIGPTGVGKTTTIAKLAAHFSILEKKKVALITVDTYRIAAVEQLKTYGDIIGLPVEVVLTPQDMRTSLEKYKDKDLILVDTAGRSHKNQLHMVELKRFLATEELEQIENILVMSATGKNEDMLEVVEQYCNSISINKLIFTKLDETSYFGTILNICQKTKKPLSYLTTGQNVPDDIELANPYQLANLIVKGRVL